MKKNTKILILFSALVGLALAGYYFFFYKKTAYQIAADLGLYTGDDLLDNCLDDMIATALSSGGVIATGNLDWELNDALNRYKNPAMLPEDYWRIDGQVFPCGALLAAIDTTHDFKNEEVANSGDLYIPQNSLNILWSQFNKTKSSYETTH